MKLDTKKYIKLFQTNEKLRSLVKPMIDATPRIVTPRDCVACFILAKTFKTHGAIMFLVENGYSEDADMLTRTLFDAYLIIAASLKDESEETALKFLRYDDELRAKMFGTIKDQPIYQEFLKKRKENPEPNDEPVEEIEDRAQKWVDEYGHTFWQRWHGGQTTGELAESVDMRKYFETAYSLQSQLTHSLPRSMNLYLVENGDEIRMDVEPKERGIDLSLVSAFNMLFDVATKFNGHYKCGYEKALDELAVAWVEAVKEKNDQAK